MYSAKHVRHGTSWLQNSVSVGLEVLSTWVQFNPPFVGAVHSRSLVLVPFKPVPLLQLREHGLHSLHSIQVPFTKLKCLLYELEISKRKC